MTRIEQRCLRPATRHTLPKVVRRATPWLLAVPALAMAQAVYDVNTQVLTVPVVDVAGQPYRDLKLRLDPDGRVSIVSLVGPPGTPAPELASRVAAATATAQGSSNACAPVRPFYWEIGDRGQKLAGGSVDSAVSVTTYEAGTPMSIASASKWIYAAYVAERRGGTLTAEDIQFLNFRSGYDNMSFGGCDTRDTVASCVARNSNGVRTPADVDRFYYNGGHMQKHASLPTPGMGLGALDNAGLAAEVRRVLGTEINLLYTQPQLAGGITTTARDYATFLRKLLAGQLKMSTWLGTSAVCTNPTLCTSAVYAPLPASLSWHYSVGHWIEDDPQADGAFSSPGAFGFYPWIDATRSYYGVLARVDFGGAVTDSIGCGALIRRAWMTGVAQ